MHLCTFWWRWEDTTLMIVHKMWRYSQDPVSWKQLQQTVIVSLVFVQIKQTRYIILVAEIYRCLDADFITPGQSQASCFPLFLVYSLSLLRIEKGIYVAALLQDRMTVYSTFVYIDIVFFFFVLQIENHISDIDNWVRSVFNIIFRTMTFLIYKETNESLYKISCLPFPSENRVWKTVHLLVPNNLKTAVTQTICSLFLHFKAEPECEKHCSSPPSLILHTALLNGLSFSPSGSVWKGSFTAVITDDCLSSRRDRTPAHPHFPSNDI